MSLYYQDEHVTLYHGDCLTEHREWLDADVLVSDVPYGMSLRSSRGGHFGLSAIAGDGTTRAPDEAIEAWGDRPSLIFGRWSVPRPPETRMVLIWEKGEHVPLSRLTALPNPSHRTSPVTNTPIRDHRIWFTQLVINRLLHSLSLPCIAS